MSGKPFNTKSLGRVGKAMLRAAGGGSTNGTGKDMYGETISFDPGESIGPGGGVRTEMWRKEAQGSNMHPDSTPEWTDAGFISHWGAETGEGIRDFGVGTLQDPDAPKRRERDWDAMQKADRKVLRKRGRRDSRDDARSGFGRSVLGDLYDPYRDTRTSISDFDLGQTVRDFNPDARAGLYRLAGKGFDVGRAGLYGGTKMGLKGAQRGAELGWRGTKAGARLGYRGVATGAKYGVIDPLKRAGGLARSGISATDAKILYAAKQLRSEGQRLGTATRGSKYLGLQKGAIAHTLPQSTGSLNGVMRGLAGLFILFIFISVFYMVFGSVYDVLITNFLSIAGADGSTMLGGKDIAVLYANTANAILIWVPLIVIGGTLYLLISMVFERESKGLEGANIMTEWDVFGGMDDDTDINLDIALDGGMDDPMGFYGPS